MINEPGCRARADLTQIGRYHGFIYHPRIFVTDIRNCRQAAQHGIKPGWSSFTQLFVQLPAGGGTMRDPVIGAKQLSGTNSSRSLLT